VPTQEIKLIVLASQAQQLFVEVLGAGVVHHGAFSGRVIEQSLGNLDLEDPRPRRCVLPRVAQGIPVYKIGHQPTMVGSGRLMLNHRLIQFGGSTEAPDRLILSENLPVQRSLDSETLDLVYVDPPFGTGTMRRGRDKEYLDQPDDPESLVRWLESCLTESHRLLRPTGSIFVHLDYRCVHYVKVFLDSLFGREQFVNEIIWCYSEGGKSKRSFGRKHDTILWYGKTAKYAFYPDEVHVPRKPSSHMRVVMDENGEPVQEKTDRKTGKVYRYPVNRGKIPEDWWTDIEVLNRSDRERVGWPTQKPARLLERIIKATTKEGDLVADWFSGSGTTAVAAQSLGRGFIATDREPKAILCAEERLAKQGLDMAHSGSPPSDLAVEEPEALGKEAPPSPRQRS
jgi:DNA modification methylase